MQAGRLRHRVTIQHDVPTRNTFGELVPGWTDLVTVWGAVEPLSGQEFFSAQQFQSKITTRIRIRYRTGITPKMRVSWDSRIFEIDSVVEPRSQRRELHLMCTEVQG